MPLTEDAASPALLARPHRPYLLGLIGLLVLVQGIFLSPKVLEEQTGGAPPELEMQSLSQDQNGEQILAEGIPRDRIPEYSVEQFEFVSTKEEVRQWQIVAARANLYNHSKLVHARVVKALLYDADGKVTVVHGREAKYFMNQRDLEIYGDVRTEFPDGFTLKSEYLRYLPNSHLVEIPTKYAVSGTGVMEKGQSMTFSSNGFHFEMQQSEIQLPKKVNLKFSRMIDGKAKTTQIESDYATILRKTNIAKFTMAEGESKFVKIIEPTMVARARRGELNYGDYSQILQYMTLREEVLIKEVGPDLRYATAGLAEFDSHKEIIRLSEFPQVYQDRDTVTGDVILMHRDTDIVEVDHSNAFSQSTPQEGH